MEYEVANGDTIPYEGDRNCLLMTLGARSSKCMTFQVADVHKALFSVTRVADAGFDAWLSRRGGYLIDTVTGDYILAQRKGNLYVIKSWIKHDEDFTRQG